MGYNLILICVQALIAQVLSQCWAGPEFSPALYGSYNGLAAPFTHEGTCGRAGNGFYPAKLPSIDITPTGSSAFSVTSGSCIPVSGLTVVSDNVYEGSLAAGGELPFVGTTTTEGVLPSLGSGVISHACGNGLNAMSALSLTSSPASVSSSDYGVPALTSGLASPGFITPGYSVPGFIAPGLAPYSYAAKPYLPPNLPCNDGFLETPCDIEFTPTSSGDLPVSSASAVPPTGLSVASKNVYDGTLAAAGELPFVGTVGLEGVLPSAGAGAVNHHCGDGINAMVSDNYAFGPGYGGSGFIPTSVSGPAAAPTYAYRGWDGRGCGCSL